jgi:hypothetical protein
MLDRERTSALVRLGQAGDADAFAELVRAYRTLPSRTQRRFWATTTWLRTPRRSRSSRRTAR